MSNGDYDPAPHDPLRHEFVGRALEWLVSLSELHPEHLTQEKAGEAFTAHLEETKSLLNLDGIPEEQQAVWERRLRARLLVSLEHSCQECRRCELWRTAPPNQPEGETPLACFGEGAIDPLIMICAEGPGNFEARTGIPLVGNVELRASHCANMCTQFERCYTVPGEPLRFKKFLDDPLTDCRYEEMTFTQQQTSLPTRLARHKNPLHTTGELLDGVLGEVGLMRSAPHRLRRSLEKISPGRPLPTLESPNVYCTNAVRHRSAVGGRNADPTAEQVAACRPWLDLTIRVVRPRVIVALGTPGFKALGPALDMRGFAITRYCPESPSVVPTYVASALHPKVFACVHPSYIMREDDTRPGHKWRDKLRQVLEEAKKEAQK